MLTLASLFDGIAGFPLAGSRHGITPVWASEIEKFPAAVSAFHFPDMVQHGDVTKIDGAKVEPVDIITFGSPCQDLSVAGKRAGMKHDDIEDGDDESEGTRSGLFMEAVRIIKEMRNATRGRTDQPIQPRYAVWENVPGAFSSNQGKDFHTVLSELAGCADGKVSVPRCPNDEWEPNGCILGDHFSIAWRTLDAQYWGVPQRRNRIYLVCDFGGQSAPQILFKREGLSGHPSQSREAGKGVATDVERGIGTAVGFPSIANCMRAKANLSFRDDSDNLVVCAGFKGNQGSLAGSIGYEVEVAPTILAGQEGHVMFSCGGFSNYHEDDKAAAQRASIAKQADVDLVIIPINDQATHENGYSNGSMVGKPGDPMYSLTDRDRHAVALHDPSCPLDASYYKGCGERNGIERNIVEQSSLMAPETYQKCTGPLMANSHPGSYSGQDAYTDMFVLSKPSNTVYNNGIIHGVEVSEDGNAEETRPGNILQVLRETVGKKAFEQWGMAVLDSFQEESVLRQDVHGDEFDEGGNSLNSHSDGEMESTAEGSRRLLHRLWERECPGCTPQGWESIEQFIGQLTTYLQGLSHPHTSGIVLQDMWKTSEGIGVLRQALSEVQKIWESTYVQAEPVQSHMRVRRLTPGECEKLQGFPSGWTNIPGASDSGRYKALGNSLAIPCAEFVMAGIAEAANQ